MRNAKNTSNTTINIQIVITQRKEPDNTQQINIMIRKKYNKTNTTNNNNNNYIKSNKTVK